jgi:hypothetical protein
MYINRQKIFEMMDNEKAVPLENESEIEDLIVAIKGLNKRLDFLKKLKENRIGKINEDIEKHSLRKERLQDVIIATLEKINEKSLSFPGVGKVIVKHPKGKWEVKNEEDLIELLKKELSKDDFDAVVPSKPSIAKKELNKILDVWEKSGKLPTSVEREKAESSLTVTIDKSMSIDILEDIDDEVDNEVVDESLDSKSIIDKGYDSITI